MECESSDCMYKDFVEKIYIPCILILQFSLVELRHLEMLTSAEKLQKQSYFLLSSSP